MLYGQIRVLKAHVEKSYKLTKGLDACSPALTWIVLHATWLLNRYQVHSDGLTSYQRRWNRNFAGGICSILECVHWRKPGKHKEKLDDIWSTGVWCGRDTISGENYVSNCHGSVIRVRTIRRLPPSQQYQLEHLEHLNGTPDKMKVNEDPLPSSQLILAS